MYLTEIYVYLYQTNIDKFTA